LPGREKIIETVMYIKIIEITFANLESMSYNGRIFDMLSGEHWKKQRRNKQPKTNHR